MEIRLSDLRIQKKVLPGGMSADTTAQAFKTQLHKHIPFSQFPLVPRLFCIIINILSPFYDQFSRTIASGFSREGTNTACYISKNGLPFESTQRERTTTHTFPTYIAKLQTRKNT